ncbi:MAG: hypothetical protein AB1324_07090 [Candidatus Micrarchaeota archaeon]
MARKVTDRTLLVAGLIIVLSLLVLSCAVIGILLFSQPAETGVAPEPEPGPPGTAGNGTEAPPLDKPVPPEDLEIWNQITRGKVEDVCLEKAREEAGSSADLVYSCECSGSETATRKTYGCGISTADPFTEYFANIDCFLDERACSIETNYGVTTLTFDELRGYE